ncbi:MAG: diacylglycerol/lipid kinase family protein [Acidimicrobiales bacterium]
MAIAKGAPWGVPGPLPAQGVVVRSDAEARAVVTAARRAGEIPPALGLLGGDLCRTLGGRGDEGRLRSPEAMTLPCDLGSVLLDGRIHFFVAHLVARGSWWRGRVFVAMNAAWLGRWNLGPRAHPGDGLLDTYDARLTPRQALQVRARLPQGAHLPHPGIAGRRAKAVQVDLGRRLPVRLDGEVVAAARALSVRVEPDALTVVV